jgi:hypothetical protein
LKKEELSFTENDEWDARFIRLKIITLFDIIATNEQGLPGGIHKACFLIAGFQSYRSCVLIVLFRKCTIFIVLFR